MVEAQPAQGGAAAGRQAAERRAVTTAKGWPLPREVQRPPQAVSR